MTEREFLLLQKQADDIATDPQTLSAMAREAAAWAVIAEALAANDSLPAAARGKLAERFTVLQCRSSASSNVSPLASRSNVPNGLGWHPFSP